MELPNKNRVWASEVSSAGHHTGYQCLRLAKTLGWAWSFLFNNFFEKFYKYYILVQSLKNNEKTCINKKMYIFSYIHDSPWPGSQSPISSHLLTGTAILPHPLPSKITLTHEQRRPQARKCPEFPVCVAPDWAGPSDPHLNVLLSTSQGSRPVFLAWELLQILTAGQWCQSHWGWAQALEFKDTSSSWAQCEACNGNHYPGDGFRDNLRFIRSFWENTRWRSRQVVLSGVVSRLTWGH